MRPRRPPPVESPELPQASALIAAEAERPASGSALAGPPELVVAGAELAPHVAALNLQHDWREIPSLAEAVRFANDTRPHAMLIDASEELRLYESGQRLVHRGRNMLAPAPGASTGAALFAQSLRGGAAALGAPSGIALGNSADLVSLDAGNSCLVGRSGDALIDGWIFAGGRGVIDCVWRHGVKVVSQGRHHARDTLVRQYRAVLTGLLA